MDKNELKTFFQNKMEEMLEMQSKITEIGNVLLSEMKEKVDDYLHIPDKSFNKKTIRNLYGILKEHSLYRVMVKIKASNVEHESILFTGFNTGSYWVIYNNNYDIPVNFTDIYCIKIIELIHTKPD